jgi:hypothetical protein
MNERHFLLMVPPQTLMIHGFVWVRERRHEGCEQEGAQIYHGFVWVRERRREGCEQEGAQIYGS